MAMPGGCLSTGRSKFSRFQPRVLNNYSKSVASQRRRVIALLRTLQKKLWHKCTAVTPDAAVHNFLWEALDQIIAGRLEKIIGSVKSAGKFIKDNAKYAVMVGVTAAYGLGGETARGGEYLSIYNGGESISVNGRTTTIKHIQGAIEGKEGYDSYYTNNSNPLQIYSVNNNCDPNKLSVDSRDQNSVSSYNLELLNNGFTGSTNNYLEFIPMASSISSFEWNNLFFDINGDKKDIKYLINNGVYDSMWNKIVGKINLGLLQGTQTGVYNSGTLEFFNHADLNRDRKVDLQDFAILGNVWRDSNEIDPDPNRFGSYVGKDVNDLGAYADIDRSGAVDINDLGIYCSEYLWDADDPNTW